MTGRRREARYLTSPPWAGALQTLDDVVVERFAERDIWVLSTSPAQRDEALLFEMPSNGKTSAMNVRVVESRPVVVDDRLVHRVRLRILSEPAAQTAGGSQT